MSDTKLFPVISMLPVPCESLCQRISQDSKETSLKRKQRKMIFYPETQRINQITWTLSQEPSRRRNITHMRLLLMGKTQSCAGRCSEREKGEEERGAERKMRKDEEQKRKKRRQTRRRKGGGVRVKLHPPSCQYIQVLNPNTCERDFIWK